MKNKCTIIVINDIESARWAVNYIILHPSEKVINLALTTSSYAYLNDKNIEPLDYFKYAKYPEEVSFSYSNKPINKKSFDWKTKILIDEFINKYNQLKIDKDSQELFSILWLTFFSHFIEIIRAFYLFKKISLQWQPKKIYLPRDFSGALATLLKTQYPKYVKIIPFSSRLKINSLVDFRLIKLLINTSLKKIICTITSIKRKRRYYEILFHSNGENLSFYNDFFDYLAKNNNYPSIKIISDKQTIYTLSRLTVNAFNYQSLNNYYLKQKDLLKISKEINSQMNIINRNIDRISKVVWSDLNPTLRMILLNKLKQLINSNILKIIKRVYISRKILTETKPKLLITTSDPSPGALEFVLPAKKLYINTLVLLHGLFVTSEKTNYKSKYYAVWGKLTKKWFSNVLNKTTSNIFEIGFSRFDKLFQNRQAFWQIKKTPRKIKPAPTIGILLTPLTHLPPDPYLGKFLYEIFNYFNKYDDHFSFKLRTHPYHSIEDIEYLNKMYRFSIKINTLESMESFLSNCDIVISLGTTAIIWPILFGKPLIHTTVFWGDGVFPTKKYGASWSVKNPENLFNLVQKIIKSHSFAYSLRRGQKKFLRDILGPLDGESNKKLSNLIRQLINN